MTLYRAEITGINENVWSTNSLEYDTPEKAKHWLDKLSDRWFGYDLSRVVETTTPLGEHVDLEKNEIYQNFRK